MMWLKSSIALGLGVISVLPFSSRLFAIQKRLLPQWQALIFLTSRFVPFAVAFYVLKMGIPTDIRNYFYPQARKVAAGLLPIIDFESSYNFGFPMLLGLITLFIDSPLTIIAAMILAEGIAFYVFARLSRFKLDGAYDELLVLWMLCPVSFIWVTFGGQDEALILLFGALTAWLMWNSRPAAGGLLIVVSLLMTKLIAVFAFPGMLAFPRQQVIRMLISFFVACAIAVPALLLLDLNPIGASNELARFTSGNVWALLMLISPEWPAGMLWQYMFIPPALLIIVLRCWLRPWPAVSQFMRMWALTGACFMVLSPKSYGNYVVMFLPGILYLATLFPKPIRTIYFAIFFPLIVIHQTLWFQSDRGSVEFLVPALMVSNIVLLGFYVYMIFWGLLTSEPAKGSGNVSRQQVSQETSS